MAFEVRISSAAAQELRELRVFDERRIAEAIRAQLTGAPQKETRNRKSFRREPKANFEYTPPLWELRVGEFRVFYDVDEPAKLVVIHAVRQKPSGKTTEEVLNEADRD